MATAESGGGAVEKVGAWCENVAHVGTVEETVDAKVALVVVGAEDSGGMTKIGVAVGE